MAAHVLYDLRALAAPLNVLKFLYGIFLKMYITISDLMLPENLTKNLFRIWGFFINRITFFKDLCDKNRGHLQYHCEYLAFVFNAQNICEMSLKETRILFD
jgi:hypothetical protein